MAADSGQDVLEGVMSLVRADLDSQHERLRRMSVVLSTALSASRHSLDRIQEFSSALASPVSGALPPHPASHWSMDSAAPAAACPPALPVKLITRREPSHSPMESTESSDSEEPAPLKSSPATIVAEAAAVPASIHGSMECPPAAPHASREFERGLHGKAASSATNILSAEFSPQYSAQNFSREFAREQTDALRTVSGPRLSRNNNAHVREDSPEDAVLLQLHLSRQATGTSMSRRQPGLRQSTRGSSFGSQMGRNSLMSELQGFQTEASIASSDGEVFVDRRNAIIRLCARLGKQSARGQICGEEIHTCLTALGIIRYGQEDIDDLITLFKSQCPNLPKTPEVINTKSMVSCCSCRSRPARLEHTRSSDGNCTQRMELRAFAEVLLNDSILFGLDPDYQQMSFTIREVLFSGDANRLVAELTHVRVDDVAAPPQKPDLITTIEPLLAFVIVLNGIFIGVQTGIDSNNDDGVSTTLPPMFWGNLFFTGVFLFEILLRARTSGMKRYMGGNERWWNMFDLALMLVSFADLVLDALSLNFNLTSLSVLRVMRLTRLTRLLRIFRLRYMRELNLMVRGLLGGLYTLFWAVLLLFFTLYVIAVMATTTIGSHTGCHSGYCEGGDIERDELFSSLSRSILTSFRCFMGDCTTSTGKPIVQLLSMRYGFNFVLFYMASMIFVVFGVFNLIVAVYIENTMNAAKTDGEKTKAERHRESVRVAQLTRQLLKKFCAAQKLMVTEDLKHSEVKDALRSSVLHDVGDAYTPISKEMFLCVIQDASVQKIMDDLDIPPERAYLFDVLDADSSGGLEVAELITGLLQVRGEAKKCDVVGALLAVRAVQGMLQEQDTRLVGLEHRLDRLCSCLTIDNHCGSGGTTPILNRPGHGQRKSKAKVDPQLTRFKDDEISPPSSRGQSKETTGHASEHAESLP